MAENQENKDSNILNVPDGVKKIKISIPQLESKDAQIAELNKKIGEHEGTIKAMLKDHSKEFIPREPAPPTIGGDTAPLHAPQHDSFKVAQWEDSDVPTEWVKGNSALDVLNKVEQLSKIAENKDEYKKILGKLAKKSLTGNKALDMTFTGSNVDFVRMPKLIGEWDSDELKAHKQKYNEKLRKNRTEMWDVE
jgi:hypothetical protein